ncbi:hypothetical protein [Niabella aurantiaca]|uniref:hypothetical protein n=1 Tax=Niabella aurantiaca TaxID=379900 RepID=UPI000593E4F9|nr:hypothetical protein [Niabella aurantiaca]
MKPQLPTKLKFPTYSPEQVRDGSFLQEFKLDLVFLEEKINGGIEGMGIALDLRSINYWFKSLIDAFQYHERLAALGYPIKAETNLDRLRILRDYNRSLVKCVKAEYEIYERGSNTYVQWALIQQTERLLSIIRDMLLHVKDCENSDSTTEALNDYYFKVEENFSDKYKT